MVVLSIQKNDGHFVYPLDDTYIHMAMAKNFVLHGVWGVTQYGFSSSTSSPLWTLLLSLFYAVFGVNEIAPFILNLLFGTLIVFSADMMLKKHIHAPLYRFLILCLIIFATPLPTLTFISMEHVLHGLLNLWFVYLAARALASETVHAAQLRLLMPLAFFLTIARYESLFAVFIVCVLLLFTGKWRPAILIGASGLLPVVLYGFWSAANGWYFIPNSVLVKANVALLDPAGNIPHAFGFLTRNILFALHLVALLIVSVVLVWRRIARSMRDEITYLNVVFIAASLLQIVFARVDYLFRYEAYLVLAGLITTFLTLHMDFPLKNFLGYYKTTSTFGRVLTTFATAILIIIFEYRILEPLRITPYASANIYQQQYQMARFLGEYYPTASVALNDIGAISYYTQIHLTDLAGLGSMESARALLLNRYTTGTIRDMAQKNKVSLAIVYVKWYLPFGGLPSEWRKAGEWEVQNNVILGGSTVTFFAVLPASLEALERNLFEFSSALPQQVIQQVPYTEEPR